MISLNLDGLSEFDNHKILCAIFDRSKGLRSFIAIHRGNSTHPAFGATRLWSYKSETDALKDALNLSKIMSYKAALAGMPYGGAKGIIISSPTALKDRNLLLRTYALRLNYLNGHFITGADVGLDAKDVGRMKKISPFIVGVKTNPVRYTALGLYYSIQLALDKIFGTEEIKNRSFAILGLGKIGTGLLKLLYRHQAKIYVADINKKKISYLKKKYPLIKVISPNEIHKQKVDVYSPCALSNCLTPTIIRQLHCQIIVGGANKQLKDKSCGVTLYQKGILYAPDYIVNAGGLISVVDEYENHTTNPDRITKKVLNIKKTLHHVLEISSKHHRPTNLVADDLAEKIFNGFDKN